MGLVPFKTVSPEGAPQEDATIWNGPGRLECAYREYFKTNHIPTALPWAASELPLAGASDLAEVPASFLKNSAGLIHGIPIAKAPENSGIWYQTVLAPFLSYAFDDEAAQKYATIRHELERHGQRIGPHDLMIAAICVVHECVLVTANESEFERVPGLNMVNWQKS